MKAFRPARAATARVPVARARPALPADSVAVHSARRALAMLPSGASDRDLVRADAHDVLSLILDEQNRADLALDHARRALALRRAGYGEIHEEVAESWYRLGSAQMSLGQVDSALVTMRTGLETRLGCNIESDRRIGDFHTEIAELLEKQGDPDAARAELDIALREYETRKGRAHSAMVQGLQRAGLFEMRNGDLARAVDLSLQALTVAESVKNFSPANLALLRGNLAVMLSEMGDFARAHRLLGQVVPVYQTELGMDHRQTLWAEVALATTEASLGDTLAAAARFRSVCDRFEAAGSITSTGSLTQARVGLAELVADRDPRAALALIDAAEAVERLRPDPNWGAMADVQLVRMRLLADLGDGAAVARADAALERTLEEHDLHGTDTGIGALAAGSLALAKVGRTKEAVARARAGASLSRDRMLRDLRALPDREGLTLAGERSTSLDALLSLVLAGHGDPAVAWDELIRWRGLVRDEVMRRRLPAVALGDTSGCAPMRRGGGDPAPGPVRGARGRCHRRGGAGAPGELRARADDAERRWAMVAPRTHAPAGSGTGDVNLEAVRSALLPARPSWRSRPCARVASPITWPRSCSTGRAACACVTWAPCPGSRPPSRSGDRWPGAHRRGKPAPSRRAVRPVVGCAS